MYYDSLLSGLSGKTDLVVLPEMCTTGFTMKAAELAEPDDGESMTAMSRMAVSYGFAIAGSFIGNGNATGAPASQATPCFNRGFFIYPDGKKEFYSKKHLFSMGAENTHYQAGTVQTIVSYLEWHICLMICYDLRFPVWTRNVNNGYDLLLVVANWPEPRRHAWESLLTARAIENMAYVCGVNRVGTDGLNLHYTGDSRLLNAYGTILSSMESNTIQIQTLDIDLESLRHFRTKFPVWQDADRFTLD